MEARPLDRMWVLGRTSLRSRIKRWESKSWQIGQCALAAGVAVELGQVLLHGREELAQQTFDAHARAALFSDASCASSWAM